MGADRAPKPEVEGAILAARHYDVEVVLVGKEEVIRGELEQHRFWRSLPISIVNAREVIGMQEKAAQAVRAKRDSSMRVGLRMVRDGKAAGFRHRRQYRRGHGYRQDGAGCNSRR